MKAFIITPFLTETIRNTVDIKENDLVLCADVAYLAAKKEHIEPNIIIGDFDHGTNDAPASSTAEFIRVPSEKDDTDTMLCVKCAVQKGADEVVIVGGIGGRLDHTFANLQTLAYIEKHGAHGRLITEDNEAFLISRETHIAKKDGWYLSVFAYDGICTGVTITGTKYEVSNVSLNTSFPLGVSNEITAKEAVISVKNGTLLIILSKKD
ncbi:MAG: thiamine diphosphokinase [Clostridia bacterium]|nr:thiamine diphosphokinase [Clostridia bacterium]